MRIDTSLNIKEYVLVVAEIVSGFFDENGEYTPHIGKIAAMETFYNHCVEDKPDQDDTSDSDMVIDAIFANEDFIHEFNDALCDCYVKQLNFGNAYCDAIDIVTDKRSNIGRIVTLFGKWAEQFFTADKMHELYGESKRFQEALNSENITKLSDAIKNIK